MSLETLLHFRNLDSTENLNSRLAGLIPKGIVKGGLVVPEPASLQVRIKGDGTSPFILLAFASDGMVVRERSEEHVLPVEDGITSVICLRAKYVESLGGTVCQFEVIPLGSFESDPDPSSLVRLCSVSPPAGVTAVLSEHIDMGYRDSIEGFTRRIVREVVGTKEDLPSVSGFPAMAEINFLGNGFVLGSTITMGTPSGLVAFPIVPALSFQLADPSVPGLSRVNPSQKGLVAATQSPLSGIVTAVTTTPHGFVPGQYVRISNCSAAQANQLWLVRTPPGGINFVTDPVTDICTSNSHGFATGLKIQLTTTGTLPGGLSLLTNYYVVVLSANTFKLSDTMDHAIAGTNIIDITNTGIGVHTATPQVDEAFFFSAPLTVSWSGVGGSVVDNTTNALVTATTSPGVTHSLVVGDQFTLIGSTDRTFEGLFTVITVIDAQSFTYNQSGYPTANSGNGTVTNQGASLPDDAIQIGESATATALNFQTVFNASLLGSDITATAIGSSLQFVANTVGVAGNSYTLAKVEPGLAPADQLIVLSGATFAGGVDPNPSASTNIDLIAGDLYVVMYGSTGTMEIWGYDGVIFRNLTSASTATILDFHRRNQFLNEKHVTENEKAALLGSVGVPSSTNRYLTQADTSTLTVDIAAALTGADNVAPSGNNRYLTEARVRGQRSQVDIPSGLDYVEIPLSSHSVTFTADPVTNICTSIGHGFTTGIGVQLTTTGTLPSGLSAGITYFVVVLSANTFSLSDTQAHAIADTHIIDITDVGLGSHTSTEVNNPNIWSLVVGADNSATDSSYAVQFFNLVFKTTLYDPSGRSDRGGPTEYAQEDFTPVTIDRLWVSHVLPHLTDTDPPPFPSTGMIELNPSIHVDSSGVFPRSDATALGKPTRLWAKLSQTPNNGSATLLYSKVVTERYRHPSADMLVMPQRILPAQVQDLINRTKELRFNAGIKTVGTAVQFPANLFTASNVQEYLLTRFVGSRSTTFTGSFSIDFKTGSVTGNVSSVSLVPFTVTTANKWTKYLLALTPQGFVQVRHIANLLEKSTDTAYATAMSLVSSPSLPFSDGSFVFAAVNVQSDGTIASTNILDLLPTSLELYPYQGSNEKDYGIPIICGDGVTSFGHFTGTDSHIRALSFASAGRTIKLEAGVYYRNLLINKDDITLDGSAGAVLSSVSSTAITVVGKRFTAKNLSFINCTIAIDLQGGSDNTNLIGLIFDEASVGTKIKSPSIYPFSPSNVSISPVNTITLTGHSLAINAVGRFTTTGVLPSGLTLATDYYVVNPTTNTMQVSASPSGSPLSLFDIGSGQHYFGDGKILNLDGKTSFNQWTVSDGSNLYGVGDFNSPSGIQQAHDIALAGDIITILPGVYSKVTVSKSRLQFKGLGGGECRINGAASSNPCLAITGSYNQFDNLTLENAAVGIDCQAGSTFNTFSPTVTFSNDIGISIRMPQTDSVKHYNYHPLVSGRIVSGLNLVVQQNPEVTVGDGSSSYGDYVGPNAINVAIANESEGTKVTVQPGTYTPILLNRNNFVIQGSGAKSVVRALAPTDTACITIVNVSPPTGGGGNRIAGFYCAADNNESSGLVTLGVDITGDDNYIEDIKFEATGPSRVEPNKRYLVRSGFRNRFVPHTGAPSGGYISWTVGDGVHSFGDFNGGGAITEAINALPTQPSGTNGILSGTTGSTVTFSDPTMIGVGLPMGVFVLRDLYRYICIMAGPNAGTYKITSQTSSSVTLTRYDGLSFTNETNVYWNFLTGSKIWCLPGQYDTFSIPNYRNDIDIEAWGGGSDTLIVGDWNGVVGDSPLLQIDGNRCRIKGFRFVGGVPVTGIAIQVNGSGNLFEDNRYETAIRYGFGTYANDNQIYDTFNQKTTLTVSNSSSYADFIGSTDAVLQAALTACSNDSHINRILLDKGTWTLSSTVNVPTGVILEGSGYQTKLMGNGLFPALTLNSSGHQTVKGIRFNTFSNSLTGPASGVFAYGNWLESAPINGNVTGSLTLNI